MDKNKSLNSLQKFDYDSFENNSYHDEEDVRAASKSVRWTPPASPNAWKRLNNRSFDSGQIATPSTLDTEHSPQAWTRLIDSNLDEEDRTSIPPDSSWNSKALRYPSRNSLVFRRGSDKLDKDAHSVFSLTQLLEYVSLTIVAIIMMLFFGFTGLGFNNDTPACEVDHHAPICNLNTSLKNGATQYQVLAAFILGGFVLSSVNMWRTRRSAYSDLCNATRNLIMILAAMIPNEKIYERSAMIRWTILAYELSVLKARNCIETTDALEYLQTLKLVEEDEWDKLVEGNQSSTVYLWILTKLQCLIDEGSILPTSLDTFARALTGCRMKGNDLMARNDRDQPRPYCFICAVLVNLNLLLTSLSKGLEWAILLHNFQGRIFIEPVLYVEIFVLFTFNAIFAKLFDLCSDLYNPFGPRSIDIPHASISKGIRKFAKEILAEHSTPSTMQRMHSRRQSFVLDHEDSHRLDKLEKKLSKTNKILGRSMLLRPGKSVLEHQE